MSDGSCSSDKKLLQHADRSDYSENEYTYIDRANLATFAGSEYCVTRVSSDADDDDDCDDDDNDDDDDAQGLAVLSAVSIIYLSVIIYLPAKRELESGIGETPVMCTTVEDRRIDNDMELCK